MKYKILFLIIAASLIACTPEVEVTTNEDAQSLVDNITYVKSKNGVCFGVVTVSRMSSGGHVAVNQMLINV